MLFLDEADVAALASMEDAVVAVRRALRAQADGQVQNATRQRAHLGSVVLTVMGGSAGPLVVAGGIGQDRGWLGAKVYVTGAGSAKFWLLLFDHEGVLRCLLEADRLGQLRTGAATGVSVDLLARPESRVLACLGAGYQAWTQVQAVAAVRELEQVLVWSRTPERAQDFVQRLHDELGITARTVDRPADAVDRADVVVTMTAATDPVLAGTDLRPGTHVVLAGSNNPGRREGDAEVFRRAARVYVDDVRQAQQESGDLRFAVKEGAAAWADVATLGETVAAADKAGPDRWVRPHGDEAITVFCSQGVGSWDVALASDVYRRAMDRGAGAALPVDGAAAAGRR